MKDCLSVRPGKGGMTSSSFTIANPSDANPATSPDNRERAEPPTTRIRMAPPLTPMTMLIASIIFGYLTPYLAASAESECHPSTAECLDYNPSGTGPMTTNSARRRGYRWDPDAPQRCNITRLSRSELYRRFGPGGLPSLYPNPVVVYHDDPGPRNVEGVGRGGQWRYNARFVEMTRSENLPSAFEPGFNVTLSSSNSFSAHRRTVPLERYLEETALTETYPDMLSNETWYFFGETYGPEWKDLLLQYEMPPCETCPDREMSALAFGFGNVGSGVQWHMHGPGFSEAVHGRKHWVLYPPGRRPTYDADRASRHWMEESYPRIKDEDDLPWECTLSPSEMVYFPDQWYHATINLDSYTAFVSTFTTEHI